RYLRPVGRFRTATPCGPPCRVRTFASIRAAAVRFHDPCPARSSGERDGIGRPPVSPTPRSPPMCERLHAMTRPLLPAASLLGAILLPALPARLAAQGARQALEPRFSIEQVLSPGFAYELVAARAADRIAWIENQRGVRNVYTAAAPDFTPVRLTHHHADDGVDLTGLQIS